uniref:Uncharacterized protein n=1 Tax=Arundo donax TaxID=35708 RepID=A0A0A9D2I0_ARUDO
MTNWHPVSFDCLVESIDVQMNPETVFVYLPQTSWISAPSLDQFLTNQAGMGSEDFKK